MNKDIHNFALQILQLTVEYDDENNDVFDKSDIVNEIYSLAFAIKELTHEDKS